MNDFMNAYQDFTQHFVEIDDNQIKVYAEAAEKFWSDIEKKAEEYEVTCDYYMMEFM